MNKIKIFKTSSREFANMELYINVWAEEEKVKIEQISVVGGESYTGFGNRTADKEIFLIVLYSNMQ